MKPDTLLIHADGALRPGTVVPVLDASATFPAATAEEFAVAATTTRHSKFYGRYGTPTHEHAECIIAALEGAEAALTFASGMAAITTSVLAFAKAGDHVICQRNHYGQTHYLMRTILPSFGIAVSEADETSCNAFEEVVRSNTRLIVVETPSNPGLTITDLRAVAQLARHRDIVTVADNTVATPILQQPISHGIDLVVHSATKFFGGHSDLMAGMVAGGAELVERVWKAGLTFGGCLGASEAWLLARSLRTLAIRVRHQSASAQRVAEALVGRCGKTAVRYPGLVGSAGHELARRQMTGFGSIVAVDFQTADRAERFMSELKLFARAASLGAVESLVVRPTAMLARSVSVEEFAARGIGPGFVRLSVGLEDPDDLVADVLGALDSAPDRDRRQ